MSKIDFNSVKTQRAIVIILVGIIASGLIWYFQISPQSGTLSELQKTAVRRQEELNKILILRPQLERMRVDVANLQREMDSLEAIFPINPDVPGLITEITKIARAQRIAIINFRPAGTLAKEYYVENYYDMSILGSYHNIGEFLAKIANFSLLVNIDRVNVRVGATLASDLQSFEDRRRRDRRNSDEMIRSVQVSFRTTTYSSLQGAR